MSTRKLPRALLAALGIVLAAVTLGCVLMFAAAKWPGNLVLMPIGGLLMAGGCIVAGIIVALDRVLPIVLRVLGGVLAVAGLVAFAATVNWIEAAWHRL